MSRLTTQSSPAVAYPPYLTGINTEFSSETLKGRPTGPLGLDCNYLALRKLREPVSAAVVGRGEPEFNTVGVNGIFTLTNPLQVGAAVVRLYAVNVVNVRSFGFWWTQESPRNEPVNPVELDFIVSAQDDLQIPVSGNELSIPAENRATSGLDSSHVANAGDFIHPLIAEYWPPYLNGYHAELYTSTAQMTRGQL